jgi:hypothetical protein
MNQEMLNSLISKCRCTVPDFISETKWTLLDADEPDSKKVMAEIDVVINVLKPLKTHIICTSEIYNRVESMEAAVKAINEKLLSKLQTISINIYE